MDSVEHWRSQPSWKHSKTAALPAGAVEVEEQGAEGEAAVVGVEVEEVGVRRPQRNSNQLSLQAQNGAVSIFLRLPPLSATAASQSHRRLTNPDPRYEWTSCG